jgi:hypothetical protein
MPGAVSTNLRMQVRINWSIVSACQMCMPQHARSFVNKPQDAGENKLIQSQWACLVEMLQHARSYINRPQDAGREFIHPKSESMLGGRATACQVLCQHTARCKQRINSSKISQSVLLGKTQKAISCIYKPQGKGLKNEHTWFLFLDHMSCVYSLKWLNFFKKLLQRVSVSSAEWELYPVQCLPSFLQRCGKLFSV